MTTQTQGNRCPQCNKLFSSSLRICPDDGTVLEPAATTRSELGGILEGKYRLDAFLSHGGMGSVYKATHLMLGRTVAVKLINPEIVTSPEIVRRFQREARATTALNHPNIVGIYDLGQTSEGTLYIAMEFVNGPTLKSVITSNGPMRASQIVPILRQVGSALSSAHRHGIVHRDLKPHNIMLAQNEQGQQVVKLVDFGIAKTFDEATQLTMTGFALGTPQYMAPEQVEGRPVDARSDLYSLGVILYEMLAGQVPFTDQSTPRILIKQVMEIPQLPSLKNPGAHVSSELEAVAMRCLQKNPADRYQSADELLAALDAVPVTGGMAAVSQAGDAAFAPTVPLVPTVGAMGGAGESDAPTRPAAQASPLPPTVLSAPTAAATQAAATVPVMQATAAGAAPQAAAPAPTQITTPAAPTAASAVTAASTNVPNTTSKVAPAVAASAAASSAIPGTQISEPRVTPTVAATLDQRSAAEQPVVSAPQPATPMPAAVQPTAQSSPKSSNTLVLVGFAVVVLLLLAGGWLLNTGRGGSPAQPASASLANGAPSSAPPNAPAEPPAGTPPAGSPPAGSPPAGSPPAASLVPGAAASASSNAKSQSSNSSTASERATATARTTNRGQPPVSGAAAPVRPATEPTQTPPARAISSPAAQETATVPATPSVAFRCTGAPEVCSALRSAVDEALDKGGITSLRNAARADVVVDANVAPVDERVSQQFGTTFAVRSYTIEVSGEAQRTGENVPMPASSTLSYDPKFGSERVAERARLVADGIVERVKAFAAKKR